MANSCDQQPQLISALVSLVAPSAALISITSYRSFGETFLTQSINEAKNSSISKPSNYISFSFAPSLPLTPQHLISLHFTWAKPGSARVGWSELDFTSLHLALELTWDLPDRELIDWRLSEFACQTRVLNWLNSTVGVNMRKGLRVSRRRDDD